MKILVTGGFGNIGIATVEECLRRGHATTVFEVRNRRTAELAHRYGKRGVRVVLGDIRRMADLVPAVDGQDAVVHLAAILPPASDERPGLCAEVNVGGTANLLAAIESIDSERAALVEVSSASMMGPTQHRTPPVHPGDPLVATDAYSKSKIEAEALVSSSRLRYCVLRLAAVMPTRPPVLSSINRTRLIFDMPLDARCEIVLDVDVAYALVGAAEDLAGCGVLAGRRAFIAGGKSRGCQIETRTMIAELFGAMGLNLPDESLFCSDRDSYYLDWYDTEAVEEVLGYQRHSFDQWKQAMRMQYRAIRPVLQLLRPGVVKIIERQSPRFGERRLPGHLVSRVSPVMRRQHSTSSK